MVELSTRRVLRHTMVDSVCDIDLQKINEKKNLADLFTKALAIKEFDNHKSKMDIRYCAEWL